MMYTCPCACSELMSADTLMTHLSKLEDMSVKRHQLAYRANGGEMPAAAQREVRATFEAFLAEALAGAVPDWRNSDGLRGYSASVVRTIATEAS